LNIREKIFKVLFPDYYKHYNNLLGYLVNLKNESRDEQEKIIYQDRYKKVFEAIERDRVEVIAIRKNKEDEWVIVTKWVTDTDIWIKLYSPKYLACNRHPRIMSSIYYGYSKNKKCIKIEDILMEDDNIGNGSICMEYFIREIKSMNYDLVEGYLSSVDKDHFDRSIHYYKKFGFEVELNDKKSCGNIRLSLK